MPKKKPPSPVELAASIYGCDVFDLLAHHEFEDGSVAIIAPTGQKFTYPADRLLQESTKSPAPLPLPATADESVSPSSSRDETTINISGHLGQAVNKKKASTDTKGATKPDP